jgi:hypothetical protein
MIKLFSLHVSSSAAHSTVFSAIADEVPKNIIVISVARAATLSTLSDLILLLSSGLQFPGTSKVCVFINT